MIRIVRDMHVVVVGGGGGGDGGLFVLRSG